MLEYFLFRGQYENAKNDHFTMQLHEYKDEKND